MEAVQKVAGREFDRQIIEESFSHRIGALKELTQVLLDEVEGLDTLKTVDIRRGINLYDEVRLFETALIRRALRLTSGNQKRAANLLGLLPTTLNDKIRRYQIQLIG